MKRINIIVTGKVQGVGFRFFVQENAIISGLSGWTRNLPDGTVEIEAEGTTKQIDLFLLSIKSNSDSFIHVDSIKLLEIPPTGQKGFFIRRDQ